MPVSIHFNPFFPLGREEWNWNWIAEWAAALSWLRKEQIKINSIQQCFIPFIFQCSYYSQLSIYCYNTFLFHSTKQFTNSFVSWKKNESLICFCWMKEKKWSELWMLPPPLNSMNSNYGVMGYEFVAQLFTQLHFNLFHSLTLFNTNQLNKLIKQRELQSSSINWCVWWDGMDDAWSQNL